VDPGQVEFGDVVGPGAGGDDDGIGRDPLAIGDDALDPAARAAGEAGNGGVEATAACLDRRLRQARVKSAGSSWAVVCSVPSSWTGVVSGASQSGSAVRLDPPMPRLPSWRRCSVRTRR
jgi:hypothetical protein